MQGVSNLRHLCKSFPRSLSLQTTFCHITFSSIEIIEYLLSSNITNLQYTLDICFSITENMDVTASMHAEFPISGLCDRLV